YRIVTMAEEVSCLKARLMEKEKEIVALKNKLTLEKNSLIDLQLQEKVTTLPPLKLKAALSNEDIMRYSRQLILPEFGVQGQLNLSQTSVLVVGCGGLGCPLAQYLAAAGIGRVGLLDYDEVELSNLHRQVLHGEDSQGQAKAQSAAHAVRRLNSTVECIPYHFQLSPENKITAFLLLDIIHLMYDIVADCSDNVPTRYLVNDACVLSGKPLVSASALRMEGQLTVYNYRGGPCYRCLYPKPPPPEMVTNCSDGGILGVVPGIMGCFQALEVLKIASGQGSSCGQQLLMFDAQDAKFRSIRLRSKQASCAVCGENPTVTHLVDYEKFCGSAATDKCRRLNLLSKDQRVTVQEYKSIVDNTAAHLLLDVRPLVEVDICHLPTSLSILLLNALLQEIARKLKLLINLICLCFHTAVYVICKLGNDSQKAVQVLEKMSGSEVDFVTVKDICGGLMAWAQKIDPSFPQY
uniref:Adenylyltransferase and sulfurtransferase MOCS3 n=1 Tax=Oncorhynchus kisutch TaxID=8019 RepID=A0A8C7J793_ONCKI